MGTYTEILVRAEVARSTPPHVLRMLKALFTREECPYAVMEKTPSLFVDEFFKTYRWASIGGSSSHYHMPREVGSMWYDEIGDLWYIFHRSDLKNYEHEIKLFWRWSRPYIVPSTGDCVGWTWHEDADAPTLEFRVDADRGGQ
jgi:hypothetical protein